MFDERAQAISTGPCEGGVERAEVETDPLLHAIRGGQMAFCEEVARDGAQGKTLLNAAQRAEVALRHAAILGEQAARGLVFAAGFPAIGPEEFSIIRQLAEEVRCCQLLVVTRANDRDVRQAIESLRGARWGRLFLLAPCSEEMAQIMLRCSVAEAAKRVGRLIAEARSIAPWIHVDVALVDAPRSDFGRVSDAVATFHEEGGAAMVLCDTVGSCTPLQVGRMVREVRRRSDPEVVYGIHMHNDLGFGLAGTFEALRAGIRYPATSWLGLGERSGLAATEQLLVGLAADPGACMERYGFHHPEWGGAAGLLDLVPLASDIARWLDLQLRVTDPVVGSGVNSISTGTPFQDPARFAPYDAEALLGVKSRILVTQLASRRVMREFASRRGVELAPTDAAEVTREVKSRCYGRNRAVLGEEEVMGLLRKTAQPVNPPFISADRLAISDVLPTRVMAAAALELPADLARVDKGRVLVSPEVAAVCREVAETDFSQVAWQMDDPSDREKLVLWAGIGGSFLADFAANPDRPRVFAWILSPCATAAQYSLQEHKGRDGRRVPTSVVTPPTLFHRWIDQERGPVSREQLLRLLELGPVGLRVPLVDGSLPDFFVSTASGGSSGQAVFPGRARHWEALLSQLHRRTGHRFLGATSANFSSHSDHPRASAAHHQLTRVQADMGALGIPIVAGPVSCDGVSLPPPIRAAGYDHLSASFRGAPEAVLASSDHLLPTSLSLLCPRSEPGVWDLVRHGSLHATVLTSALLEVGVCLERGTEPRLLPAHSGPDTP